MLQQKLLFYGHCLFKTSPSDQISLLSRRLIAYDSHESPTVPHQVYVTPNLPLTDQLPSSCRILIAGGGIIGQSIAYHLSEIGVKDVVLVEKFK